MNIGTYTYNGKNSTNNKYKYTFRIKSDIDSEINNAQIIAKKECTLYKAAYITYTSYEEHTDCNNSSHDPSKRLEISTRDENLNENFGAVQKIAVVRSEKDTKNLEKTLSIKIKPNAKVSINNYIYKVNGRTSLQYIKKDDGKLGTMTGSTRASKDDTWKKENPIILEVGDKITYRVEIKNNDSTQDVYFKLWDTLPGNLDTSEVEIKNVAGNSATSNVNLNRANNNDKIITKDLPQKNGTNSTGIKTANGLDFCILLKKNDSITYEITVKNGVSGHNNSDLCESEAKLGNTLYIFKNSIFSNLTNQSDKKTSYDYFKCKKYNVSVNAYFTNVARNGGGNTVANEVTGLSEVSREGETNRATNCIWAENGDILTYKIVLNNEANDSDPYYSPKAVSVDLQVTLPANAEIKSISAGNDVTFDNNKIIVSNLGAGTKTIKLDILTNKTSTTALGSTAKAVKVSITNVTNCNGKTTKDSQIINDATKKLDADYYKIKEYNVVIDNYISKVEHATNTDVNVTFDKESRKSGIALDGVGSSDNTKVSSPVYVERGDKITYTMLVYNTTDNSSYNVTRANSPYKAPQNIKISLKDSTNLEEIKLYVNGSEISNASNEDGELKIDNVNVPAGAITTITVSGIIKNSEKGDVIENKLEIVSIENINGYSIKNKGKRSSSSDFFKVNDYSISLNEYVSSYNAEMAKYNNEKGFVTGENLGFTNSTKSYSNNSPLDVEKYETLIFATKITNTASENEAENDENNCGKYATRIRPTEVTQTIEKGLNVIDFSAVVHRSNGTEENITDKIERTSKENTNDVEYQNKLDSSVLLSPGEYVIYYTTVEVTESNLCLKNLSSKSEVSKISNVNQKSFTQLEKVLKDNCTTSDSDYVRLKDIIISGKVWFDADKDGSNNNENAMANIKVRLFHDKGLVSETTTDANGFYTFGRRKKSSTKDKNNNYTSTDYMKYYVEFVYDGVQYKATEVYGGDKDGNADGMQNLGGKTGSASWRQGEGLPGTTSGKSEYMIDSNAYEFDDVRNKFNSDYEIIGYNKSYTESGVANNDLEYTKNGHTSTLNSKDSREMIARSFIVQNYSEEVKRDTESNTNTIFLNEYSGYHNESPETEYLKYINLGLVEREKIDLSIESDVATVTTIINGEEMTYKFDANDADSTRADYDSHPNAYKLSNAYELNLYRSDFNYRYNNYYNDNDTLKNYKGEKSELNVQVTYKIRITNNQISDDEPWLTDRNIPIETAINELAVYYDKNFVTANDTNALKNLRTTVKVKNSETGLLENKNLNAIDVNYVKDGNSISLNECINKDSIYGEGYNNQYEDKGYNVLYLNGDKLKGQYLKEGESGYIYVTFVVDKETIDNIERSLKLADVKEANIGLEAISEIGAYTTRYGSEYKNKGLAGKNAGLIDRDSNPGNVKKFGIETYNDYEDDTYKAGIKMNILPENSVRSITGKVWNDTRSETVGTDQTGIQYLGNGIYDINNINHPNAKTNPYDKGENKDKPISGVRVSLVEIVQTGRGKYYEYIAKDSNGNKIQAITDENGQYTLKDYLPGYYIVRFEYGYDASRDDNVLYNGQDYKSTKYHNGDYYGELFGGDNLSARYNDNYFNKVKSELSKPNNSDAADDEIRRLNVNSYSETMTAVQAKVFSDTSKFKNTLINNTNMYADTTIFYAKPEEVETYKTQINANTSNINSDSANNNSNFDTTRLWKINNLDFGLEYRPESSIVLDKNIDNIELITSDNKALAKIYFKEDENGNRVVDESKSKGNENVQFLPNSGKELQGFVYINMDSEILEGCTIKVNYKMDSENNSEIDRINKNLDNISYEVGANDYTGAYKVYVKSGLDYNYSANGTAAEFLAKQYYAGYRMENGKEIYDYLTKIKKPYTVNGATDITKPTNPTNPTNSTRPMNTTNTTNTTNKTNTSNTSKPVDVTNVPKPTNTTNTTKTNTTNTTKTNTTKTNTTNTTKTNTTNTTKTNTTKTNTTNTTKTNTTKTNTTKTNTTKTNTTKTNTTKTNTTTTRTNTSAKSSVMSKYAKAGNTSTNTSNTINSNNKTDNVKLFGSGYYGIYLGQTYYSGVVGANDVVAKLKVDSILDYVDNDFTFSLSENSSKNNLWKTTTSQELRENNMLDFSKVYIDANKNLIDKYGIRYDTENRSNLALSVDSNRQGTATEGNISLSRFLNAKKASKGKNEEYIGTINAIASKVLSPEDISKGTGLNYENIAEIIQYTSLTGRRTTLPETAGGGGVIGNADVRKWTGYEKFEEDTDASEVITISPPTGLTK